MKRLHLLPLAAALMCIFTACGQDGAADTTASITESTTISAEREVTPEAPFETVNTESGTQSQEALPVEDTAPSESESAGTLIAYFSWSGNTEQMAQMIQTETGGDLFEIAPAVPYTDDYNTLLDVAQAEQSEDARPVMISQVENWDSYDVVFVGYPNWWNDAPMIIYSFLEAYDWNGKTLIPFCTSGGSAFGRSTDKLPDSASGAEILDGLHISGSRVDGADEDVAEWIDGLNLS